MSDPNARAYAGMIAAEPALARIAPLARLVPSLGSRTLLHAGPPFAGVDEITAPILNAAVAAAMHEGWADGRDSFLAGLAAGEFALAPAQDHGVVTPLAFVVGPSMYALEVVDAASPGRAGVSPLNDGPMPHALRLGAGRPEGLAIVRALTDGIGAALAAHLRGPVPLLPVLADALAAGDDLHGRVSAAQTHVRGFFGDDLPGDAADYLVSANQFVLNVIMAACAVMLSAGAGVAGSSMLVAAGGNGREMGWKVSAEPDVWQVRPALAPVGPRFPGRENAAALPAIGDSAVIDATGFGAACLRFAPELAGALEGHIDPRYFSEGAHDAYLGPHPALPAGVRVGLDLARPCGVLGIMLGIVEASGADGLIGRGVAPWPED